MKKDFASHILAMLRLGRRTVRRNPFLNRELGKADVKGVRTVVMDLHLDQIFLGYIKKHNLPVGLYSEESGLTSFHSKPTHFLAIDPLDGSTNYKLGKGLLPFGTFIAIYRGLEPRLKDVVAAGAVEYTRNLLWIYDGKRTLGENSRIVRISPGWQPGQSTPLYTELFYKESYEMHRPLAQKVFIRESGSAIGNLSYVLAGAAAGMSGCMRAEEIGAVCALIKGAGGLIVAPDGGSIFKEKLAFDRTYRALGGSKKVVSFVFELLKWDKD